MKILLGFAIIIVIYALLFRFTVDSIIKTINLIKSCRTRINDIWFAKKCIEKSENMSAEVEDSTITSFKWSQQNAICDFIMDYDYVHFDWISRDDNIICLYNKDGDQIICRVVFENNDGVAEIIRMDSFDDTIHYNREEETRVMREAGDEAYYAAKVAADNEYRQALQNELLEQGGEALYDAKRLNNNKVLPPNELSYVVKALRKCDYDIGPIDFDKSIICIRLSMEKMEA